MRRSYHAYESCGWLVLCLKELNVNRHGKFGIEQSARQESGSKVTEQPLKAPQVSK